MDIVVEKGDPVRAVKAPVEGFIEKALTEPVPEPVLKTVDSELPTYKKFPTTAILFTGVSSYSRVPEPLPPVEKGDPVTAVSEPLELIEKAETELGAILS